MSVKEAFERSQLIHIMKGMGIQLTAENIELCEKVCLEYLDEQIAGAILRHTNLVFSSEVSFDKLVEFGIVVTEEEKHICDSCRLEARKQALDLATMLNENKVSMYQVGKDEILKDAEDIFNWMIK